MANEAAQRATAIRAFNRFYTQRIGVLDEGILDSPFSLTEVRVLYELAHRKLPTASQIGKALGLDAGYLSRILRTFETDGYLERRPSKTDSRSSVLALTAKGRKAFAPLDKRSERDVTVMLSELHPDGQDQLLQAMGTIRQLLDASKTTEQPIHLRAHRPGDIGWAIARHGTLYAAEYGWDEHFEALVAEILGKFIQQLQPLRERCWIAELNGQRVGCVFLVRNQDDPKVAQLRCLLVEPSARGFGVGRRLVEECVQFARQAGYRHLMLWTNNVLVSARRIYEAAGFQLRREEAHHSFGKDLVGQFWEMDL